VAPNWHFLAKDVRGVTTARREFTAHLRRLSRSEANLEAAALIFGELIANAIKYGDDPITATLERGEQYARLVIEDGGGFAIATKLARSIRLEQLSDRFRITVELPVAIEEAHRRAAFGEA
jgi:anti-sigma regulatory factor (Ser/Thr protein kinase)